MIETNIEASDNTATEVLRHSQMKSARGFTDGLNAAEVDQTLFDLFVTLHDGLSHLATVKFPF